MSHSSLIFAKALDGNGGAENCSYDSIQQGSQKPMWFHFDANVENTMSVIKESFPDIDHHSLEAIFDHDARPRMLELDHGTLIILRGINHNEDDNPEDMIAVRLWVTNNRLISLRYRQSKALMTVSHTFDKNKGPKSIGDIITAISSNLFRYIEVSIDTLNEQMDIIESDILEEPNKKLRQNISNIRKQAIKYRRYIAPQKEAVQMLHDIQK